MTLPSNVDGVCLTLLNSEASFSRASRAASSSLSSSTVIVGVNGS